MIAALAAFLIRQPVTIAVKAYSGRRARRDLPIAGFWIGIYGIIGLLALTILSLQGFNQLLVLAIPGLPVFAWHLLLISRRAERRQAGIEIVGSGVLALSAPAAYWVGMGVTDPLSLNTSIEGSGTTGWWLFALTWLQSAASIVYAYLRLDQRDWSYIPPWRDRMRRAWRSLLYTSFNLALVIGAGLAGMIPASLFAPYALQWGETIYGTLRPAVGVKPTRIGVRQLLISSLFTLLFIFTWH